MMQEMLTAYLKLFPDERSALNVLLEQVEAKESLNDRRNFNGHITGSAIVLSPDKKGNQKVMKLLSRKKLNIKGFSHVEALLVLVVLVAIVAVGGLVYSHHNKAHAGGWQYMGVASAGSLRDGNSVSVTVIACKTLSGSTWIVKSDYELSRAASPANAYVAYEYDGSSRSAARPASVSSSSWSSNQFASTQLRTINPLSSNYMAWSVDYKGTAVRAGGPVAASSIENC
jgi:hypothetical protein